MYSLSTGALRADFAEYAMVNKPLVTTISFVTFQTIIQTYAICLRKSHSAEGCCLPTMVSVFRQACLS